MSLSQHITEKTLRVEPGDSIWRRVGQLCLQVREGPDEGKVFEIDAGATRKVVGGRSHANHIVLDDEQVSGTHFEISVDPARGVVLTDLGSTNGITMDKVPVLQARLLPGARFCVGSSVLELLSANSVKVELSASASFGGVYGSTPIMRELFARLEKIARIDHPLPVLVVGATGTGKELVAQELHAHSRRADKPFVAVNCATIPASLAESYLFGHKRGAFTGAIEQVGCFEAASGGTLFLDEIGELPLELQPKLLRVLQEGEICRVGEHRPRKVDTRVIAATHRDLRRMAGEEKFREDLFFRFKGVLITLPELKERAGDIVPLAERFLERLARNGGSRAELSEDARTVLSSYSWPGNIRELRRVVETAYFLSESPVISGADLDVEAGQDHVETAQIPESIFEREIKDARTEFDRLYFRRLLARSGSLKDKAKLAGITYEGLRLARERLGLK